jgi:hypothetical protein
MKKMDTQFQTPINKEGLSQEPSKAHKNTPKEEILQEITENLMDMLLDKVNQNV